MGVTLRVRCTSGQTLRWIRLVPAHQALQHVVRRGKYIPHIVKNRKAESLPQVRQSGRGKTQFQIVDEQRSAADGETGAWVTGTCLI